MASLFRIQNPSRILSLVLSVFVLLFSIISMPLLIRGTTRLNLNVITSPLKRHSFSNRILTSFQFHPAPARSPISVATMASYSRPPQAPPLFNLTKGSIEASSKEMIRKQVELWDQIVANIKPENATWDNVMKPTLDLDNTTGLEGNLIGFIQNVSTEKEIRDAAAENIEKLDEVSIELSMRKDIFNLIEAVYQKRDSLNLDPQSLKLLEKRRTKLIDNGLALPDGPERDRITQIQKRLSSLSIEFAKCQNEDDGGIWLTPEELDGLPQDTLDGLKKGEGDNSGKLWLTLKDPDAIPVLKFVKSGDVRKQVLMKRDQRCATNVPLFKETIVLRDEMARLLGYPDFATYAIKEKMAKDPAVVHHLLSDLRERLQTGAKTEIEKYLAIKKAELEARGEKFNGNFDAWDFWYLKRSLVEKEYQVEEDKIAEYFPLQHVVTTMLSIFEELMGFKFVQLDNEAKAALSPTQKAEDLTWHKDVMMFSVWDNEAEGGEFSGYLYFDLHPRDGKYTHAACWGLQTSFDRPDGQSACPVSAVVCNFTKPTASKPSLLKHNEVVTLFHELGHGIHGLAGRGKYSELTGTNVAGDFVEAPSQMLEHWCWTPSVLKRLSSHYESGQPITDKLIDQMVAAKKATDDDSIHYLRQIFFGTYDMALHTPKSHQEAEEFDCSVMYNKMRTQIIPAKGPEFYGAPDNWGSGQANFGHLMHGYEAGYYGYLYSQVYSADMYYTVFAKNPMDPTEGRRYRRMVLEKGRTQDELKTLTDFLGRPPNADGFYKSLGLRNEK